MAFGSTALGLDKRLINTVESDEVGSLSSPGAFARPEQTHCQRKSRSRDGAGPTWNDPTGNR